MVRCRCAVSASGSGATSCAGGKVTLACNMLNAFINQASAQSGKQLTTDQADQLIASANQIRAAQGCPQATWH